MDVQNWNYSLEASCACMVGVDRLRFSTVPGTNFSRQNGNVNGCLKQLKGNLCSFLQCLHRELCICHWSNCMNHPPISLLSMGAFKSQHCLCEFSKAQKQQYVCCNIEKWHLLAVWELVHHSIFTGGLPVLLHGSYLALWMMDFLRQMENMHSSN